MAFLRNIIHWIFFGGKSQSIALGRVTDSGHQAADPKSNFWGESGLMKEVFRNLGGSLFRVI